MVYTTPFKVAFEFLLKITLVTSHNSKTLGKVEGRLWLLPTPACVSIVMSVFTNPSSTAVQITPIVRLRMLDGGYLSHRVYLHYIANR